MKKLTVIGLGLLLLVPALAFSDSFSLRVGYFLPQALSNSYLNAHPDSLWAIEFGQMSFSMNDSGASMFGSRLRVLPGQEHQPRLDPSTPTTRADVGLLPRLGRRRSIEGDFAFPYEILRRGTSSHSFRVTSRRSSSPSSSSRSAAKPGSSRSSAAAPAALSVGRPHVRRDGRLFRPLDLHRPRSGRHRHLPVVARRTARRPGPPSAGTRSAGSRSPSASGRPSRSRSAIIRPRPSSTNWFEGFDDFELGGLALTVGFSYWF